MRVKPSLPHGSLGLILLTVLGSGVTSQQIKKGGQLAHGLRPNEQFSVPSATVKWSELVEIQRSLPDFSGQIDYRNMQVQPVEDQLQEIALDERALPYLPPLQQPGVQNLCIGNAVEPPIAVGFDSQLDVADTNGFSFIPPNPAGGVG